MRNSLTNLYYLIKPVIPRRLQIALRRKVIQRKRLLCADIWPIDERANRKPEKWSGWPDQKRFALILTHDVDTANGQEKCRDLLGLEKHLGFRSSFNFVPERYKVSSELRHYLASNGFEVGVHGLYHDGKYFRSKKIFQSRTTKINYYLNEWKAVGFYSPSMLRNLEWIHDLDIEYDASTFDTDPFEPQPDGAGTIFPFWVQPNKAKKGYVELPYTLPQDFTLFILMKEKNIDVWKKKLNWIAQNGGMALVNIHPDYMNFDGGKLEIEEYPARYYEDFLKYIEAEYGGQYWQVLPKDISRFWRNNVVPKG